MFLGMMRFTFADENEQIAGIGVLCDRYCGM
jgi:hypothetical protein